MSTATEIAESVFRQLTPTHGKGKLPRFVAVPGNDEVRWLLPFGGAKARQVLANWSPYRWRSRMGWAAIRAANLVGHVRELPGAVELAWNSGGGADWASLGWQGREEPIPVIYLGSPGPQRKAVVHLVERGSGKCQAVVKVPLAEEAKAAILHEADVLELLEKQRYGHAPRLLHVDPERGVTTQTFVEGHPGRRRLAPEHWRLLRSLLLPGETTSLSAWSAHWGHEAGSPAWAVEQLREDSPLPACWEHGDFAPWNIRRTTGGECALLDWENARRGGLPLMDAFHFLHMQNLLFGGRPQMYWPKLWDPAMEMGIAPSQVRSLELAYLVCAVVECTRQRNATRQRFLQATLELSRRRVA